MSYSARTMITGMLCYYMIYVGTLIGLWTTKT